MSDTRPSSPAVTGKPEVYELRVINGERVDDDELSEHELEQAGSEELFEMANHWHYKFEERCNSAIQAAINSGRALNAAKSQVPRGKFMNYVETYFLGSQDLANKYMKLAANSERVMNLGVDMSLRAALSEITAAKKAERESKEPSEPSPPKPSPNMSPLRGGVAFGTRDIADIDQPPEQPLEVDAVNTDTIETTNKFVREEITAVLDAADDAEEVVGKLQARYDDEVVWRYRAFDDLEFITELASAADVFHLAERNVHEHLVEVLKAHDKTQQEIASITGLTLGKVRQILTEISKPDR